jgi:hypothetical protein
MGIKTADMPPVDPAEFGDLPFMDRMRLLATHWVDYGFGGPKQIHLLYVFKLIFYVGVGLTITFFTTPGLGGFGDIAHWWSQPIVYQKLMIWTILFETLGLASSSGPLAFKFSPMIGGCLYWARTGTIRVAPWPGKVPGTAGDERTWLDVGLYLAILANLVFLLVRPGVFTDHALLGSAGQLAAAPLFSYLALLVVMGLRDKTVFLASRAEQYVPTLFMFAALSFTNFMIGAKLAIVIIWMGAAVSKFGYHFTNVIPPMLSNTPWISSLRLKRSLYRDYPEDLRPSKVATMVAHVGGTVVEICIPLTLLFSTNRTITLLAILGMITFHLFITSTFPLAVPLEWNIFFCFATATLFWNFPAQSGFGVGDLDPMWLLPVILAALLFFPILGNLRPDLVSFLPSMRQYAGNWASATWAFRPGAEEKLNTHLVKTGANQVDQLTAAFGPEVAEIFMQKAVAWRTMHSQGRALISLMMRHLDSLDAYTIREAEFTCSTVIGWQFGDGHLHNEALIESVQKRCNFEPGEVVVVWIESQPIHKDHLEYKVIDAALGVVERGTYRAKDAVEAQPWLPDGPIPHAVTWTLDGYAAPGVPLPGGSARLHA